MGNIAIKIAEVHDLTEAMQYSRATDMGIYDLAYELGIPHEVLRSDKEITNIDLKRCSESKEGIFKYE